MSPIDIRSRPTRRPIRGSVLCAVACLAAVTIAVAELAPALAGPAHVPRLRIVNPTAYHLNIDTTDHASGAWLDLGTVGRERSKTVEQVLDQGDRWVIRFSYGGVEAGQIVLSSAQLQAARWVVEAPADASGRLRDAGFAPSAP